MQKIGGQRQYVVIDVAAEQWDVRLIPQSVSEKYLGGQALGLYLCSLHAPEEEPFCFVSGALAGSKVPCSNTLSLVGRSQATGLIESSTSVTEFAHMLVSSGWQAIVLVGIARRPMVLHINSHTVEFNPCERLLGKLTHETSQALETETPSTVLSIGPAGENGVVFASVFHEEKPLDRHGFGALLGQKHIKAIVVEQGSLEYGPVDAERFRFAKDALHRILERSSYAKEYAQHGALALIPEAMRSGFAAVENVTKRVDPRLFHLSGDELTRQFSLETTTCEGCLLNCRRSVMRPGGNDLVVPDALGMMALGSNLGNYDSLIVMQWWEQCIALGLNPMGTGMVIGWIMAAKKEGYVDFSTPVTFGKTEGVEQLIEMIGKGSGEGLMFGKGTAHLENLYLSPAQAEKISCHVQGREMIPIDPRGAWGQALLIGLGEDMLFIPELLLSYLPLQSTTGKADWAVIQENLLAMFNSVGLCSQILVPLLYESSTLPLKQFLFRYPSLAYTNFNTKVVEDLLGGFLGINFSAKQLVNIGRYALYKHRVVNNNFNHPPFPIPVRFTLDPASNHTSASVVPYRELAERYRFLRTLDLATIEGD